MVIAALIIVLILTAVLPLFVKIIENNLEIFLFIMGVITALISSALNLQNISEIFSNKLLYFITLAVLVVSFIFKAVEHSVSSFFDMVLDHVPLKLVVFLLVVLLGLLSSVITAIIASLLLTELIALLPMDKKSKFNICIIACFSIGLGAVLTPVGEPLSTIVVSKLHESFTYMLTSLGLYILVGVLLLGLFATFFADNNWRKTFKEGESEIFIPEKESIPVIFLRAAKIFLFVIGLELLGYGFKPVIDTYIVHWNNTLLYFANMVSAILDNATLAAAEISPNMSQMQIKSILMGLLISGGMLVTGNIPNIVCAGKLKISMKQWAKLGLPLGAVLLVAFYIVMLVL